jgi:hypothetical protein
LIQLLKTTSGNNLVLWKAVLVSHSSFLPNNISSLIKEVKPYKLSKNTKNQKSYQK